jgi:4-hydroxy-tetrahydrodipicolinate synthase
MNLAGYEVGGLRLPLCDMTDAHLEALKKSMKRVGLL